MSCVIQSLLGFDVSLRMLSVAAVPRLTLGSGDPEIQRSDGAWIHAERGRSAELGKTAFHWFQTGGEKPHEPRSASGTVLRRFSRSETWMRGCTAAMSH